MIKKKILFVFQSPSVFVLKDLNILKLNYEVTAIQFDRPSRVLPLLLEIRRTDLVFCWFGKLPAFFAVLFARIFRKKSIVVGGGDCVSARTQTGRPYEVFSNFWKGLLVRWLFKNTDKIFAVSEFSRAELLKNVGVKMGKTALVYHGFDEKTFIRGKSPKDKIAVTIGTLWKEDYIRKGYVHFIECARRMPDYIFYLVGPQMDSYLEKHEILPGNLRLLDRGLYGNFLIELLNLASVYVQLSEWETFGCAVAEAMLCECVPIVSRYGALPEVVGDCGFYVDSFNPLEVSAAVRTAYYRQKEIGPKARKRIIEKFPLEKREEKLIALTGGVLKR